MRFPTHLLQKSTFRSEPMLAAMAAIAVGMFVGTWVIGPAITRDSPDAPAAVSQERTNLKEMVERPDPMPYRAPTPAFDMSGPPNYAAVAKEKARAELGGEIVVESGPPAPAPQSRSYRSSRYRSYDRHAVY
jgi:hypothetical protein